MIFIMKKSSTYTYNITYTYTFQFNVFYDLPSSIKVLFIENGIDRVNFKRYCVKDIFLQFNAMEDEKYNCLFLCCRLQHRHAEMVMRGKEIKCRQKVQLLENLKKKNIVYSIVCCCIYNKKGFIKIVTSFVCSETCHVQFY